MKEHMTDVLNMNCNLHFVLKPTVRVFHAYELKGTFVRDFLQMQKQLLVEFHTEILPGHHSSIKQKKKVLRHLAMTTMYAWHVDKTRGVTSAWQHVNISDKSMLD